MAPGIIPIEGNSPIGRYMDTPLTLKKIHSWSENHAASLLSFMITNGVHMDIGKELRKARLEEGISLRRLAILGDTSPAAISQIETGTRGVTFDRIESLLARTRHRLVVLPTVAPTASEFADGVADFLAKNDVSGAFRTIISFSDALRKQEPGVRVALVVSEPESTGSPLFDAAIAAVVEHWLSHDGLPLPPWVLFGNRFLPEHSHLAESIYSVIPEPSEIPPAFAKRNILFPSSALESV